MAITLDPSMSAYMNTGSVYNNAQITAANRLSNQIETASTDEDTLQACKDFEAYMLEQIFKRMNDSAKLLADDEEEGDSTSSQYVEMFEDNYYQDITKKMMASGQSIGIAEQLYQSITNQKLGISNDTTTLAQAAAEAAQQQTADSDVSQLASMLGVETEDVESMTASQKAESLALASQNSFASSLLNSDSE